MNELFKVYQLFNFQFKKKFWILITLSFISVILETIGVGIIIPLVSLFNTNNNSKFYLKIKYILNYFNKDISNNQIIITCLVLVLVFFLIKNLFLTYYSWFQNTFSNAFINFISSSLFETYIKQPYNFHLENNSSRLITNISGEVEALRDIVVQSITLISEILIITSILILLIYFEPTGSIVIIVLVVAIALLFIKFTKKYVSHWGKERSKYFNLLTKDLMQGLGGIKDIIILGREEKILKDFKYNYKHFSSSNRNNNILASIPRLFFELFSIFSLVLVTILMLFQEKSHELIIPILSLFAFSAFRLMPSINKVFNAIQHIRFCLPSIVIIFNSLKLKIPNEKNDSDLIKANFSNLIEICGLSFSYNPILNPSINNASFSIKKNSTIGIIGESGSGKSTLIDLILGLLKPTNGQIKIDGYDIHESFKTLRAWQNNIGYVSQQIYLTDDSIRNNIALGIPSHEIDNNQIKKVIKECQLEDFIQELPNGVETIVGERGARISGGQRQRIGIARALYNNPSILVFDEATSALDNETEKSIVSLIKKMNKKTVIMVAHRLSTVEHCELIIKLKGGNIENIGTFEQVVD